VFEDVADLVISPPPPSYIQNPANAVGSGAPDNIDDDTAYGYTWVFGDTAANYVTGGDGFIVNGYVADIYPVENVTQGTYFATISAAISAAAAYDEISVGAGTYYETLNITVEGLEIIGVDEATVIVDPTGFASNGAGIYVNANNVTLESLTMNSTATNSIPRYGIKLGLVDGCTLENVTAMETYRSGIDALGTSNLTILNVSSVDNGGHGLSLVDCNNVTVTNTTYSGNAWQNVSVATWGNYSPLGTSGIVFSGTNDFGDLFQLEMGDFNNPGVAPAGAAVITYSTNIGDGADVTVQGGDFGFAIHGEQNDSPDQVRIWFMSTLVNAALVPANAPAGHWTGVDMYIESLTDGTQLHVTPGCTIQAAVDAADSGDDVNIAAGTYVQGSQLVIDQNVTLLGAGAGSTIIEPGFNTSVGYYLVSDALVYVDYGVTATIEGLSIDGTGFVVRHAIQSRGADLTVQDCEIRDIFANIYAGRGIVFLTGTGLVENCTMTNIQRIGIHIRGGVESPAPVVDVDGLDYTGKGIGDFLDYGVEFGGGGQGTVDNSVITACLGVATVDGSDSAGILVTDYYGTGTVADITNTTLTGNSTGMVVGYDTPDMSAVTIHGSTISGNTSAGVTTTGVVVDALNNWWGTALGPYHLTLNPAGTGNEVSDNILFEPWSGMAGGDIVPVTTGPLNCNQTITLTFKYTADEYTPDLFLYNAVVSATPGLDFETITDLFPFGTVNNNFYKSETGTNQWTITGSTVGNPSSPVTGAGTTNLFSIVFSATGDVNGAVVFDSLTLRDPSNAGGGHRHHGRSAAQQGRCQLVPRSGRCRPLRSVSRSVVQHDGRHFGLPGVQRRWRH